MKKSNWTYYGILLAVWLVYAVFMMLAPVNTESMDRYHLTVMQLRLIQIGIAVPLLLIWWALVYGIVQVYNYTRSLGQAAEATAYRWLNYGLFTLLLGLIVPSFINFLQTYKFLETEQLVPVTRSINIVVTLLAGWCIWKAGKLLNAKLDPKLQQRYVMIAVVVAIISAGLVSFFIFQNPHRSVSDNPLIHPAYAGMSDAMIVLTSVIPYGIAWLFGFLAFGSLFVYQKQLGGSLFRQAFKSLGNGVLVVISFSIAMQILGTAQGFFADAGLAIILFIIYIILLMMAVAYLLIARGAKQLTKIETV